MEFINPLKFDPSMLTSSSVGEDPTYSAWNSATAYAVGDRCYLLSTHTIYECLITNTNVSPDTSISPMASPKWLVYGSTNKFAAFDDKWGTRTVSTTSLTMVLKPGTVIDSLALLNLIGNTIRVICTVSGVTKYDRTINLQSTLGVFDWKTYFVAPIVAEDDIVITDLLPYYNQIITVIITGIGTVGIGNISMGALVNLGRLTYSPTIGINNFSKKDVDAYGNIVVTERAYSKRFGGNFEIDNEYVDYVASVLASVRSKPVVWMGVGSTFSSLIVWGFFKDFEISIPYPTMSMCSITIEGLV